MRLELLIIGGGPAGLAAARAYRKAGATGTVTIVTDEARVPYRRPPLSKELLRGEITEPELALVEEQWLSEHAVTLVSGRAVALDPVKRLVTLSGGRELAYETCLLATGAEPARLPVCGVDDPAVRTLRSLDDAHELLRRLTDQLAVTVIGSGFIGCELAASLRMRGHDVTLVSDEPAPNQARLGARAAAQIAGWLADLGVIRAFGVAVDRIERQGAALHTIAGTRRVCAGLVVIATGVAPRAELAVAAGLDLVDGAVPVDASMRTATEGVMAAGDLAYAENRLAGRSLRVEHWGDALTQGEIAGATAAGHPAVWEAVPGFWSTIGTQTLKYAAWGDGYDEAAFARTPRGDGFTVDYRRDGRLVGVLTHAADDRYDTAMAQITEQAR